MMPEVRCPFFSEHDENLCLPCLELKSTLVFCGLEPYYNWPGTQWKVYLILGFNVRSHNLLSSLMDSNGGFGVPFS